MAADHPTGKVAGIMGGMGPEATVDFMARVLAATPASTDQEHIHMLVDHNPRIPNRHASIAGSGPDAGPALAVMAQRLERAGADFLVMVCNTAHAYTGEIRAAVGIPFVSIIDVVMDTVSAHPARRVGVMAADGCLQAGLYQQALCAAGREPLLWNRSEQARFMDLLYRIKAGERSAELRNGLQSLAASLAFGGAELLIAGCTEIPLLLQAGDVGVELLSSTDLLVARTVALARGDYAAAV
ncbi:aspartate/glutamate racemase family protein [Haliea sp.]|uniref:aspartate/glutamate racemase family protein n=1 Tax=Haliea sp. TaxID=1932666 RepID=UPI003526E53C